ncbi:3-phosphoshikimate 1-carboxyvinyltransferase [Pseudoalteromonas shioyasakiensis]|uniref:3-phosphoshikimate 1-carboxyvinyltransferase n=1 Tax=Pseudoalteromonas shioyasakiensis TaxID=1190813 RepID=UPI002117AC5E|nr:3-phosphoshikimate 1-carboxyvinyltransferase [Pseudoalteromonas shioyasakiensis]MCQ8876513.1 3-phosphoshikimate 1-carboxyvinyltransferase [Pseudoalteromonas shioyasakiensis]
MKKMPSKIQSSFTDEQLQHLKLAIGAREWGKHKVDFRRVIHLFKYRYYFVFLAGRNRRRLTDEQKKAVIFGRATSASVVFFCLFLLILVTFYLFKSAIGVDLFPGFSVGLWDWFRKFID